MKFIIAIIKPFKLEEVRNALNAIAAREEVSLKAGDLGRMILQWSWPRVSRFKKQSIFDLNGRGFNAAAALGGEDHQLGGVLPRAALLDMVGLIQDEGPHVRERGERGAIPQHDRAGEPR